VEWCRRGGGNRSARRETCPSAVLSTADLTSTDLGSNPALRVERPTSNHLSHGTVLKRKINANYAYISSSYFTENSVLALEIAIGEFCTVQGGNGHMEYIHTLCRQNAELAVCMVTILSWYWILSVAWRHIFHVFVLSCAHSWGVIVIMLTGVFYSHTFRLLRAKSGLLDHHVLCACERPSPPV
jgi:hypothetical protein